ncbi:hypothetical protein Lw1_gp240 [Escherichia phage Lw1]|uniref:Uncharacterized protein n=1 Tax=Escherichia phage Lw1 TaxID=1307804 RepID=M9UY51_9CAUD|nr:hypothetical protein Lw1_gp240 [Escherichia phage Lw1]AGJ71646.1 hypothetical protein Lw1_gp240 [Escherichia phage Lw1]
MVEINGIGVVGVTPANRSQKDDPRCGRSPTLAERARKLVDDMNAKMVEESRNDITAYVLKYATKQSYTFDMKRFVGANLGQECTQKAYDDLGEWLKSEGLTFDTMANRLNAYSNYPSGIRSRRIQTSNDRDVYSEFTYFITW